MKNVVVISGGSEGLGYAIAKILVPTHEVVILATNPEKLAKAAEEVGCHFEVCDVSDAGAVEGVVARVIEKFKRIDVLVNNAGIWIEGKIEENEPAAIRRVLEVNTLGTVFLTRAVVPRMKRQKQGTIINVISQAGLYGKEERSVYNASKFAITGFTKSLEPELKNFGIRVIGLYPGFMRTKMFEKIGITKDMAKAIDPAEVAEMVKFIVESDPTTTFPEVGVKRIDN
ncbi:MAG: SDR family oxidoreductase [Candidatus Jorgensenbacteria bacterium]|nr:SDR family oxidoreductase [Candidatus Jorgensenbacteria bacterium]MDZ4227608.1 SDR family oxidoreductase [Patescibacteria group bacterium]